MELYLIRHGQSTNNALEDWTRRVEDPLLTESGLRQAEHTAAHLAAGLHLHPSNRGAARPLLDRLYCSPMVRAMQTAQAIGRSLRDRARRCGPTFTRWAASISTTVRAEVGYPGRVRSELARLFPECILSDDLTEDGWWNRDHEGAASRPRAGGECGAPAARARGRRHPHRARVTR